MALTKYKLGELITLCTGGNEDLKYGEDAVKGISINKNFMETKADLSGVSLANYTVVSPKCFSFVTVTSRNGNKISIAYNDSNESFLVSSFYVTFRLSEFGKTVLLEDYLYMFFNRSEFDRYARRDSWGSAREYFYFENICDVEITLPGVDVQKKYVDIYNAMVANQQNYERGLEDLKLICDAYVENLGDSEYKVLGDYIERNTLKNLDKKFNKTQVKGFNNEGEFIKPMRLFAGDVSTFKVIKNGYFVYNSRVNSTIKKLSIALNEGEDLIVTPAYESFYVRKTAELDPFYLYMLLQREIFAKKVLFNSFGSATLFFSIDALEQIKLPVPDIEQQKAIANMYRAYKTRRNVNEKLKAQIKAICPILIRGSLEDNT